MKLRKLAWWLGGALLACVVAGTAALYWASHSEAALRWGIDFAARRLPGKLTVSGIHGALLEPVSIDALTYEDDAVRVEAHALALDWSPMALLHDNVDVSRLQIERLRVTIKPQPGNGSALPTDLRLPVQVRLASIEIGQLVIDGAGVPLDLKDIAAAYEGGAKSHRLDLQKLSASWNVSGSDRTRCPIAREQAQPEVQLRLGAQLQVDAQSPFPVSGHAAADVTLATCTCAALANRSERHSGAAERGSARRDGPASASKGWRSSRHSSRSRSSRSRRIATDIDLSRWIEGAPRTALRVELEARQTGAEQFAGSIGVDNAQPGTIDRQLIPLRRATGEFTAEPQQLRVTTLALDLGDAGQFAGSAALTAQGVELTLTTSDLNLRGVHANLRATRLAGTLQAKVAEESQSLVADLRESGVQVQLDATHQSGTVQLHRLLARSGTAELSGSGTLATASPNTYSAQGR